MFDPDLLDSNTLAQQGIKLLAESGILESQKKALLERLTIGDAAETDESLIPQIREFRLRYSFVESLIQFGEYYKESQQ